MSDRIQDLYNNQDVTGIPAHRLIIESLRDGKARCRCGGWYFSQTGTCYVEDIFEQYEKHAELKSAPVYENEKEGV